MNTLRLLGFGSSDTPDLEFFHPDKSGFYISVEFDIKDEISNGVITFSFFLCDLKGLTDQVKYEMEHYGNFVNLKKVIVVDNFNYSWVKTYLLDNIESRLNQTNILSELKVEYDLFEDD